ncbi:MAG TPA: alpha/beta fold hydrolase [Polyangiaceae bacterium]|nr:alpha/beta fold hydrolase [Polyangiaceae bacterium]
MPAPAPQPRSDEERARDLVAKLAAHDFAGAVAAFDEQMSAALPVDKLQSVWSQLESQAGAFQRIDSVEVKPTGSGDVRLALVKASFEHAPLLLRITLRGSDRVAGFFVAPGDTAAAWQPPTYAKLDAFEERSVQLGAAPALPGTLTVPKGTKSFPVVVLVHGSGPNDRDETIGALKVFKDLAFGLASRGVAVLRYDKRTHVEPTATVRTQKDEVEDAAHAAVAMVRTQPEVDASRIALVGHSQGGYLAPRIAKADPAIKGLVLLAASTRALEDSIVAQLAYLTTLDPSDAKLASAMEQAKRFKAFVESPSLKPDDAVAVPFASSTIPGSYFLDVRDYHPEKVAATLGIPMFVLQGERDYQVTVADDFGAWKTALAHKKNATLRTYPGLNHAFATGDGPPSPADYAKAGHVDQSVVDDIAAWVTALK